MRLSKCIKHFDSKCVKIDVMCKLYFDAICENLIFIYIPPLGECGKNGHEGLTGLVRLSIALGN